MYGLGTIINTAAIVAGGLFGAVFGRLLQERYQDTLTKACGVGTLFIGMSGALEGLNAEGATMMLVICLALGALLGEFLNLEDGFERFGQWLKVKTGNTKDWRFVDGFVTASLTVCIGAMAIVGAIQDGLLGDPSILMTKAVLDFVIIMIMTCSLGKGCVFSAIPVAMLQGTVTLLAQVMKPMMTETAIGNLSMVGSVLIFCVGINLVWGKKVRVANLLPAVAIAAVYAFIPL